MHQITDNHQSNQALATTQTMQALSTAADQRTRSEGFRPFLSELAPGSRGVYRSDLAIFARFLATAAAHGQQARPDLFDAEQTPGADQLYSDPAAWALISHGIAAMYLEWLKAEGYAIATFSRKLATVKSFVARAAEIGAMPPDQAAAIRGIRIPSGKRARNLDIARSVAGTPTRRGHKKADPVFVSPDNMRRLRDDHPDTPQGRRNRLIMTLFVELGIRVSEAAALTVSDVKLAGNLLHVYRIKTDLDQQLETPPALRAVLADWGSIDIAGSPAGAPLLRRIYKGGSVTDYGLSTRSIYRIVANQGERIGIKISPHDIRHSWTDINMERVQELPQGKDSIRQAGGWATMAMVDRYAERKEIANQGMGSALD